MERAIETQRLRLFRLVAGLLVGVILLSVGPVSRGFSLWVCAHVGAILSRAELAARYLVIAQARFIAARRGDVVDVHSLSQCVSAAGVSSETPSVGECRARLWALRAVLMNLPSHARRLLRRIKRQARCALQTVQPLPVSDAPRSASPCVRRRAGHRIERPPDKRCFGSMFILPLPEFRVGGAGG